MKIKQTLFLFFSTLCIAQGHYNSVEIGNVLNIDNQSIASNALDVYHIFTNNELPEIYRLGGVTYREFKRNNQLVKVELKYDGDRETIIEIFYINDNSKVFFIKHQYILYSPPKWESESKPIISNQLNFIKINDSWESFNTKIKLPERIENISTRIPFKL